MADPKESISFATPTDLGKWLAKHHHTHDELWVKVFKKSSGKASVTWTDIVLETLCWGWIDGQKKSLDDEAYLQRITPRRPRSAWSQRNTEHVARLIAAGRMKPPGQAQVDAAKADGRWEAAYPPMSQLEIPADFLAAVEQSAKAKAFFATLNKAPQQYIAYQLTTAKRPETRQRHFDKCLAMLERGETPSFY